MRPCPCRCGIAVSMLHRRCPNHSLPSRPARQEPSFGAQGPLVFGLRDPLLHHPPRGRGGHKVAARPLSAWLAASPPPAAREAFEEAWQTTVQRIFDADVWLPRLTPRQVFVGEPGGGDCSAGPPVAGLAISRLPEVALAGFTGGRIRATIGQAPRVRWLARFDAARRDAAENSRR